MNITNNDIVTIKCRLQLDKYFRITVVFNGINVTHLVAEDFGMNVINDELDVCPDSGTLEVMLRRAILVNKMSKYLDKHLLDNVVKTKAECKDPKCDPADKTDEQ